MKFPFGGHFGKLLIDTDGILQYNETLFWGLFNLNFASAGLKFLSFHKNECAQEEYQILIINYMSLQCQLIHFGELFLR